MPDLNTPTRKDGAKFEMIPSHIIALQEAKKLCDIQKHAETREHRDSMTLPI